MKHMPRRNAVIAAATSVIMLGGVAIAVPAIAASAQKSHRTTVAVHKSTHAANTSSTIPSPLATALVPRPSGPDKDNDGPDFGAPDNENDGPDFGAPDNENDGPDFGAPDNENDLAHRITTAMDLALAEVVTTADLASALLHTQTSPPC
ncbi:MAG: hypothetical protein EBS41_03220 [Actinobacteria bacterium]|nr:hypothetical protein [Actinomycetota bacterium]